MEFDRTFKILVVDDDTKNLGVVVKHFQETPYELIHAPNGKQGCKVALEELPDLILMDWAMPMMNGIDATLWLKAKTVTKDIPVLMTTGVMTTSEDLKEALEAGAMDFMRKPYDPLELTSRVEAALRLSQSYKELKQKNFEISELLEREKEYLERELAHKDRELSLQAVGSHEKNEFLRTVEGRIDAILHGKDEVYDHLRKLQKEIHEHLNTEESWEKFMLHFEKVHPDFFSKLNARFSKLTTNELRMLAYIKIGMGNKEIAQLTGVEPTSVKTFIYRLKKKMRLPAEINLREQIKQL